MDSKGLVSAWGLPSPKRFESSSCTIFTICCPGDTAFRTLLAQGTLLHSTQKIPRDLEVHVSFEENASDLTQPLLNHRFGEDTALAQLFQRAIEFGSEFVKHGVGCLPTALHRSTTVSPADDSARKLVRSSRDR